MPALEKIDWDAAYDAWILVHKPKGEITQKKYAASLGVAETWLSTRFNEIEHQRLLGKVKDKMPKVLQKSLDKIEQGLDLAKPEELASVASRVFQTLADRDGMSPQASVINIQQNNMQKIQVVPLFEAEMQKEMDGIFDEGTNG